MSFYGGSGGGGRDGIDLDFERLFGGGDGQPPSLHTPAWMGRLIVFGIAAIALLVLINIGDRFYTDFLWFSSLGYQNVYTTRLKAQVLTFLIFGAVFTIFITANVILARRFRTTTPVVVATENRLEIPVGLIRLGLGIAIGLQALIMASSAAGFWNDLLRFDNATPFGIADPLLHRDVGFYVFQYPVYREVQTWALWAVLLTMVNVLVAYGVTPDFARIRSSRAAVAHLSLLGGVLFALIAWNYQLNIFGLLFSERSVVAGAGYTDVHAQFGAYQVLTFLTAISAILLFANALVRTTWMVIGSVALWLVALIVAGNIIPALVQQFQVKPNELNLERPYIQNNIDATRQAFNLDKLEVTDFDVQGQVTAAQVQDAQATIKNIRLLDYRPLQTTYNQIQSIRQYYNFPDIDIDRYVIDGQTEQVMLGARELETTRLAAQAQTWVNLHLQYTHGYGLAMSGVSQIGGEGLPDLLIRDLPPQGTLKIDRPEIYYGEETRNWVIVNTKQQEFDYPKGDDNVFSTYAGKGGVVLDSFLKRVAFAWRFADLNILITNALQPDSKILFNRLVGPRLQTVAPFLTYDQDPYLVVDSGQLYWMQDTYTTSDKYPYSQPFGSLNYIRNSAKVVINAYDGTTTFYISDPTDPLIQTYSRIYPGMFKPLSDMPAGLLSHVRYPEDMFRAQMEMYRTYHMTDPQVFYNREDLWSVAQERFNQGGGGAAATGSLAGGTATQQEIMPYYVLMKLPGQTQEEYLLLLPFTPAGKTNMISWVVARSDQGNYGKLLAYRLPKDKLVFGPSQVESRIDQEPAISSLLSLWNTQGSSVIRGNLLVVPVGQSFLFVEPLYLQAQNSPLPELKRVIVANGDKVAMGETLDSALAQIFGSGAAPVTTIPASALPSGAGPSPAASPSAQPSASAGAAVQALPGVPVQISQLARDANDHYQLGQTALRNGDFTTYGNEMKVVQQDIQKLNQLAGNS